MVCELCSAGCFIASLLLLSCCAEHDRVDSAPRGSLQWAPECNSDPAASGGRCALPDQRRGQRTPQSLQVGPSRHREDAAACGCRPPSQRQGMALLMTSFWEMGVRLHQSMGRLNLDRLHIREFVWMIAGHHLTPKRSECLLYSLKGCHALWTAAAAWHKPSGKGPY